MNQTLLRNADVALRLFCLKAKKQAYEPEYNSSNDTINALVNLHTVYTQTVTHLQRSEKDISVNKMFLVISINVSFKSKSLRSSFSDTN